MDYYLQIWLTILFIIVFLAIGPLITMWCWNYAVPYIFKLPEIGYLHALSLNVLSYIFIRNLDFSKSK